MLLCKAKKWLRYFMDKVKVVHIITKLELGGAQENTLFTVMHLRRDRYTPVLISGSEGILVEEAQQLREGELHFVPELAREIRPLKDIIALFKLTKILTQLRRTAAIIVHTHSSKAGILGRWAACLAGSKVIIHSVHGFSFNDFQPRLVRAFYIFLERITSCITTRFIAVSQANIEKGIEERIFKRDQVVLIRSGIEIEKYYHVKPERAKKRKELGIDATIPLVAMIACFKPQKSPLDFVKVAKRVSDEVDQVKFLLVGDGILRPKIEALIKEYQIEDKVMLLGWRRDIPEIMGCIDIVVLTSRWEGLPRVFPQAMASGVPVVATGVDGAPEAIHHGVNGFLVPPGDSEGIVEKVLFLIQHPESARAMGKEGRRLVKEFAIEKMMTQQEELYEMLLAQGRDR
jgi:glycosyltransferase involved in cell wall biosynthesis